jgi:hypothetical protein
MIYAYAITDPACTAPAPPDVRGFDDAPLLTRTLGPVAAVYSSHALREITPTPENLWRHESVVESIMRQCDAVLPARFGTRFADEDALDEVLARHAEPLAAGVQRVRGCVELGLRVLWQPPEQKPSTATDPTTTGRAYMLARLADERHRRATREQAERIATDLYAALAPRARDSTRRVMPTADVLMSAAYLVPRDAAEAFAACARDLSAAHPHLRLLCTGPWPPYHFAPALSEVTHA